MAIAPKYIRDIILAITCVLNDNSIDNVSVNTRGSQVLQYCIDLGNYLLLIYVSLLTLGTVGRIAVRTLSSRLWWLLLGRKALNCNALPLLCVASFCIILTRVSVCLCVNKS